jgi:hypothetical protein
MNIELPETAVTDIGGEVTSGLSTYAPIVALLLGIILAFFVVEFIISVLRKKDTNE